MYIMVQYNLEIVNRKKWNFCNNVKPAGHVASFGNLFIKKQLKYYFDKIEATIP